MGAEVVYWTSGDTSLSGVAQFCDFPLSESRDFAVLAWLAVGEPGQSVKVDSVELLLDGPTLTTAQKGFLWIYAMLLENHDEASGMTRDRANFPAGDTDNVSASGLQAAAAVVTAHLGYIESASAIAIVNRTTNAILSLPTCHSVLPHLLKSGELDPGSEWSSIDSAIALAALLTAREALGLDTSGVEAALVGIDWPALLTGGAISHGYAYEASGDHCGAKLAAVWTDFGTESWLVHLAYAAATGLTAEMNASPPTANGAGFIDELGVAARPGAG